MENEKTDNLKKWLRENDVESLPDCERKLLGAFVHHRNFRMSGNADAAIEKYAALKGCEILNVVLKSSGDLRGVKKFFVYNKKGNFLFLSTGYGGKMR